MVRPMWLFSRIHALLGIRATLHIIFNPLDFIAKLASLVPKPRVNPTGAGDVETQRAGK